MKLHSSLTWLLLIEHLIVCNAWKSWVSTKNVLVIELEKETDPVFPVDLNYTGYKYIQLQNPKLNVLTTEMQSTISTMANFSAFHGSINSVHLMAHFSWIKIYNCSTSEVVINPNWTYKTDYLAIVYGNLKKLPKHLNLLSNLEKLYLHDNKIEFVEMAEFNGLNKLKLLSLRSNKIAEIRATLQNPAILPKLEEFYIYNNLLTDINFEHWNTPYLNLIHLHENQLQIALSLPGKLTGLKGVALDTNPLNCEWLTSTLKQLKDRNVKVYDEHITKCNATGPELKEIVRRVNFKGTFATLPLLKHSQFELKEALENKLKNFEEIDRNVLTKIGQLKQQNESLYNNFKEHEVKLIELSVNTTSKLEKLQTETRNKFANIDKANVENDQQLKKMLNNLENSIKLKILNNAKAINSTNLDRYNNFNLLQTKDKELEAQIKSLSIKAQLEKQNLSLYNSYNEMQFKFSDLSANTKLNMDNFQKEVKNKFIQLTNETTTHEQQMNATLNNLETSIKFEIINITKAINSTNLEGNNKFNLLKTKDEELEAQIRAFSSNASSKAEDLQSELVNITIQLESLQNSVLNETGSLDLHQEQNLVKLRQQISQLENERKADRQQLKQMFEELQHKLNASSIGLDDTAYGGIFKLERYSAIFVVLGVCGFLYLIKMMVNLVKRRNPTGKRVTFKSEVPIASFMDDPQQTGDHIYDSLNYDL